MNDKAKFFVIIHEQKTKIGCWLTVLSILTLNKKPCIELASKCGLLAFHMQNGAFG